MPFTITQHEANALCDELIAKFGSRKVSPIYTSVKIGTLTSGAKLAVGQPVPGLENYIFYRAPALAKDNSSKGMVDVLVIHKDRQTLQQLLEHFKTRIIAAQCVDGRVYFTEKDLATLVLNMLKNHIASGLLADNYDAVAPQVELSFFAPAAKHSGLTQINAILKRFMILQQIPHVTRVDETFLKQTTYTPSLEAQVVKNLAEKAGCQQTLSMDDSAYLAAISANCPIQSDCTLYQLINDNGELFLVGPAKGAIESHEDINLVSTDDEDKALSDALEKGQDALDAKASASKSFFNFNW